jgi:single-stranded DNA-binding protein
VPWDFRKIDTVSDFHNWETWDLENFSKLSSTSEDSTVHLNSVQLIGRVGKTGPKVQYASNGHPTCMFTLEVDEPGKGGEVFTLYLPIEIWGQAETAAETLEPGDEVMLSCRLKYKSTVDSKTQQKVSKLILST